MYCKTFLSYLVCEVSDPDDYCFISLFAPILKLLVKIYLKFSVKYFKKKKSRLSLSPGDSINHGYHYWASWCPISNNISCLINALLVLSSFIIRQPSLINTSCLIDVLHDDYSKRSKIIQLSQFLAWTKRVRPLHVVQCQFQIKDRLTKMAQWAWMIVKFLNLSFTRPHKFIH